MCGIVGFLDTSGALGPVGATLLEMLEMLAGRGPDSSGVALWGPAAPGLVVRIKLGEGGALEARRREVVHRARRHARVESSTLEGSLLRLVAAKAEAGELAAAVEAIGSDIEVVSIGERLEIVKQVGPPHNLELEFGVSRRRGTHGLGHTRLSTESRVDLSHSQPFWAHGMADLAVENLLAGLEGRRLHGIARGRGVSFQSVSKRLRAAAWNDVRPALELLESASRVLDGVAGQRVVDRLRQ